LRLCRARLFMVIAVYSFCYGFPALGSVVVNWILIKLR
jgi:hypothetical protein